ncbi:MAG: hypothetical protein HQ591_10235 [candidate division Zixibacteria bacterium]|nr:hypothetical protein [Candidatus Tariuqbacter arcticus]
MGIIWNINLAIGKFFDLILAPFASLNPFWGLAFVSLLTGAIMVIIFKFVSNQEGIRLAKAKVRGHFLEVWLYKHDFPTVIGAVGRILKANLKYMRYAVSPLIVLMIPVILIMVQLNLYYGFHPLKPGETALLTVKWDNPAALNDSTLTASTEFGITIETAAVLAKPKNEAAWRFQARRPGKHIITIAWQGGEVTKEIIVGAGEVVRLSPIRSDESSLMNALFSPGEKPIPSNIGVKSIAIKSYREARNGVLGMEIHWIIIFFVLSIVAGFALKGVFKVEI